MLLRQKCLGHNVGEDLESIELSEFDNTGSVKMSRVVERHIDMLGLVARYRRAYGAQCAVRVAVDKWDYGFAGNVSMQVYESLGFSSCFQESKIFGIGSRSCNDSQLLPSVVDLAMTVCFFDFREIGAPAILKI